MTRAAAETETRPPDLGSVQQDIDHALSRRVELPPRSVIDAGTDALVQHLRRFMDFDFGEGDEEGGAAVRALYRVADRNLDVPVRPDATTGHHEAYTYWHTIANLTAAFRDLYTTCYAAEQETLT
ncbi:MULTISPECIES: hypothetical protein [Streptomyces]|uniref:hypothetical protein n=1 Tax=Streptomyces TaxID=1883 RepID=UPI0013A569AD|nr:hypothetical protein [Streptomyces sp. CS090A]